MSSKNEFDVVEARRIREQKGLEPLKSHSSESYNEPSKRRISRAQERLEDSRRSDLEEVIKIHTKLIERLSDISNILSEVSHLSNDLHKKLSNNRFFREINLEKRIRILEILRTVNISHQHLKRTHAGSLSINKDIRESVDEFVCFDSKTSFE